MEKTLFPGDYVLVNKVKYGTKVPHFINDIPIISKLFSKKTGSAETAFNRYTPLKGFSSFKREDVVVFKSITDLNRLFIKRLIGMPGDTLKSVNSRIFIDGKALVEKKEFSFDYKSVKNEFGVINIKNYSLSEWEVLADSLKVGYQRDIKIISNPNNKLFFNEKWNRDNFGPLIIPKKNMSIPINRNNWHFYKDIIEKFEERKISFKESETVLFRFQRDYYFLMGDNRHNSLDSRFYGVVPENYIQGKMIYVF